MREPLRPAGEALVADNEEIKSPEKLIPLFDLASLGAGKAITATGMRLGMSAAEQVISIDESEATRWEGAKPAATIPATAENEGAAPNTCAMRRRLPDERRAITHHFSIAGQEGYLTVGVYEDGLPGEIFITMAKQGSTISGLMDAFATVVSLALQHGVPLEVLCDKFSHMRFEPSGWSGNPKIGYAKSLMDYIVRGGSN